MASSKDSPFSSYVEDDSTKSSESQGSQEIDRIEVDKYGLGKPKRVIIRARIIHGNKS